MENESRQLPEEGERIMQLLNERLEVHDINRKAIQSKLNDICREMRTQIDMLENRIATEVGENSTAEENRLQAILESVQQKEFSDRQELSNAIKKAKEELIALESYEIDKCSPRGTEKKEYEAEIEEGEEGFSNIDISSLYVLRTKKTFVPEMLEPRKKPKNIRIYKLEGRKVFLKFDYLGPDELKSVLKFDVEDQIRYKCMLYKKEKNGNVIDAKEYPLERIDDCFSFTPDAIENGATYGVRVTTAFDNTNNEWSDEINFTNGLNETSTWKKCPDNIDRKRKYTVTGGNPWIVFKVDGGGTFIGTWPSRFDVDRECHPKYQSANSNLQTSNDIDKDDYWSIVTWNHPLPPNKVASWCVKVLNAQHICVGVSSLEVNQNDDIPRVRGWYFSCCCSKLNSDPQHKYFRKEYGPPKDKLEKFVHKGDRIGVVMDTAKGELSFVVNGVNYGVAYEGIPLDKPLVPCVLLEMEGDCIELDEFRVDSCIPAQSDNTAESRTEWDSEKLREEWEMVIKVLNERLEIQDDYRKAALDKLCEICNKMKQQVCDLVNKVNSDLSEKYTLEDKRLQTTLNELRSRKFTKESKGACEFSETIKMGKRTLIMDQSYALVKSTKKEGGGREEEEELDLSSLYELKTERKVLLEMIENKKPSNVHIVRKKGGRAYVQFIHPNPEEMKILSDFNIEDKIKYKCLLSKRGENEEQCKEYLLEREDDGFVLVPYMLEFGTKYDIRVKVEPECEGYELSDKVEFTPELNECCTWKECPDNVVEKRKYTVDKGNPRVATNINDWWSTIIGNVPLPLNRVTSWTIKKIKSARNYGSSTYIGVAPSDINQNRTGNYFECGWHFSCIHTTLWSGPPHYYKNKDYGPKKGNGGYSVEGGSVGVVMDTTKGELSFILDGVNRGVAYEGIPLDKPLVPCILQLEENESFELIF